MSLQKFSFVIIIILWFAFLYSGCSTTSYIRDYPSKEKFNQMVNNGFDGKNACVETKEDNVLHTGLLVVAGDTLYLYKDTIKVESGVVCKTDIENIHYNDNSSSSGLVYLKDKTTINAYYIVLSNDSVFYKVAEPGRDVVERIPVNKINTAFYKTYWPGIISKAIAGGAMGWLGGILISTSNNRKDGGGLNSFLSAGGGISIGAIAGLILGVVFPTEHVYVFDPAL